MQVVTLDRIFSYCDMTPRNAESWSYGLLKHFHSNEYMHNSQKPCFLICPQLANIKQPELEQQE